MKEIIIQGLFGKVIWEPSENVAQVFSALEERSTKEEFEALVGEDILLLKQFMLLFTALLLIPDAEYFSISFRNTSMLLNAVSKKIAQDMANDDFSDTPRIKH